MYLTLGPAELMSQRLRYVLPVAQVAVTAALERASYLWLRAAILGGSDMPGHDVFATLCVTINAPVAIVRPSSFRSLPGYWGMVPFLMAVGLLWYWVALGVDF